MKARITLFFIFSLLLLTVPSHSVYGQVSGGYAKKQKCVICGKLIQNCKYRGRHPKCSICGIMIEQCPYHGRHLKSQKEKQLDLGYAKWTGGVKKGKPDGVGKMKFTRAHRLDSQTVAEEGDVFEGSYTNGQIDAGKLCRTNGEIITIIGEN